MVKQDLPLILASASPRRKDLLASLDLSFEVHPADVDETLLPDEAPEAAVTRLAKEKALSIGAKFPDQWVLAADTLVACERTVLGKPSAETEAVSMLRLLQGREHSVWGGVALHHGTDNKLELSAYETKVHFAPMTDAEIEKYVASGEPMDKAGAYAIQGRCARFITGISGSYTNVVGLDLAAVYMRLKAVGVLK